jgi:hypothetical protein
MSAPARIEPVTTARQREIFLRLPEQFYHDQPAWVPPLFMDVRKQLDPERGDFFKHSAGEFFLAWRDGRPVGRIAALHNTRHLAAHADGAGFFGFFECENDPVTAQALLTAAESWLRARKLTVMRGPANFSVQDEAGVLLDGFEHAPMSGMGYTPPYYRGLLEAAGYAKAKDLHVYRMKAENWQAAQFDRMCALADRVAAGVSLRPLNMRDLPGEAARMELIFAEAWRENWGAQPISQAEFLKYSRDYRLFINPELILFAERDGEPLGMMVAIPNMNEIVQRIGGRLWPWGWWRLLTQRKQVTSMRLFLLGVRTQARRLGLPILFIRRYHELLRNDPYLREMEFSWILEDNHETIALIERVGGYRAQTLRLYEKSLG